MAIPKKGSRTVTVKGERYRWLIRRKPSYLQGAYASEMFVAVERMAAPSRSVLLLATSLPRPDNWPGKPSVSVTPRMVAKSIESALAHGWEPERAGGAFTHPLR